MSSNSAGMQQWVKQANKKSQYIFLIAKYFENVEQKQISFIKRFKYLDKISEYKLRNRWVKASLYFGAMWKSGDTIVPFSFILS